jgi:hypothetical protein
MRVAGHALAGDEADLQDARFGEAMAGVAADPGAVMAGSLADGDERTPALAWIHDGRETTPSI